MSKEKENVSVNASLRFRSVSELLESSQQKTSPAVATERPKELTPSGTSLCEYEGKIEPPLSSAVRTGSRVAKDPEMYGAAIRHLELEKDELKQRLDEDTAELKSTVRQLRRSQEVLAGFHCFADDAQRESRPQG